MALALGYLAGKAGIGLSDRPAAPLSVARVSLFAPEPPAFEETYILNTSTKQFHYPECHYVHQMVEQNAEEYTGDRSEVLAAGYTPCTHCHL